MHIIRKQIMKQQEQETFTLQSLEWRIETSCPNHLERGAEACFHSVPVPITVYIFRRNLSEFIK